MDAEAFAQRAAEGLGPTAIGREFGFTRASSYRWAKKFGVTLTNNRMAIKTLRSKAEALRPGEAVTFLLDAIEMLFPETSHAELSSVAELGFTVKESQILLILSASNGTVHKETVLNKLYADCSIDEVPEIKIVDVFVCKLRKKLREMNIGITIETIWGRGYRLARRPGQIFPWEKTE